MKALVIDTAHHPATLWLVEGSQVKAERAWENDRQTGILLLEAVEAVLEEVGWMLSELNRIGVHAGPGGYSSLRAGVVTGQMLGVATGVDVVGVRGETIEEMMEGMVKAELVQVVEMKYMS